MSSAETTNPNAPVSLIEQWDKTFAESLKVDHRKVTFQNRYGITLVGDLYLPKDRGERKLAAIAVSGPFGAVKAVQRPVCPDAGRTGVCHRRLTHRIRAKAVATRNVASPDINTEDFSAAVDFLGLQKVDRNRIGLLGICGWGGMALNDAAMDTRVKAVATSVMYDMSRAMGHGVGDGKDRYTTADRRAVLRYLNVQRWKDAANGTFVPGGHDIYVDDKGNVSAADRILPETLPANPNPVLKEFSIITVCRVVSIRVRLIQPGHGMRRCRCRL
ncbi:hypothetical protein BANRA_00011 [Klebsiella pneumoniae]|nr:hypothetical protein BANRA_00011 [Klebsiella pneumoniae]